jgi:hypothetical protein
VCERERERALHTLSLPDVTPTTLAHSTWSAHAAAPLLSPTHSHNTTRYHSHTTLFHHSVHTPALWHHSTQHHPVPPPSVHSPHCTKHNTRYTLLQHTVKAMSLASSHRSTNLHQPTMHTPHTQQHTLPSPPTTDLPGSGPTKCSKQQPHSMRQMSSPGRREQPGHLSETASCSSTCAEWPRGRRHYSKPASSASFACATTSPRLQPGCVPPPTSTLPANYNIDIVPCTPTWLFYWSYSWRPHLLVLPFTCSAPAAHPLL